MNTEKTIKKDSGQFQTKNSIYHLSDAEIEKLAKEWVELVIAHLKCPIEETKSSLLSKQNLSRTVKGDGHL